MLHRMALYQTAKEQQLSVGTLPVLSQYHLTGSFRLFQKEHPEISLALTEVEETELMEGIEQKRFTMILARESMIDTEHYHFFPIATDRICVMLPAAKSGILAAVVLGIGRAIGETMAVVMVAGNQPRMPQGILKGVRTMTANIVTEMGYATGLHREALIATAVVLFVFILIINLSLSLLNRRAEHAN